MIVELNGNRYSVRWKYHQPIYSTVLETTCFIKNLNTGEIVRDFAYKSPNDNHNKHVGRKLSLARALFGMGFTKEQRKVFWDTYLKNCRVR